MSGVEPGSTAHDNGWRSSWNEDYKRNFYYMNDEHGAPYNQTWELPPSAHQHKNQPSPRHQVLDLDIASVQAQCLAKERAAQARLAKQAAAATPAAVDVTQASEWKCPKCGNANWGSSCSVCGAKKSEPTQSSDRMVKTALNGDLQSVQIAKLQAEVLRLRGQLEKAAQQESLAMLAGSPQPLDQQRVHPRSTHPWMLLNQSLNDEAALGAMSDEHAYSTTAARMSELGVDHIGSEMDLRASDPAVVRMLLRLDLLYSQKVNAEGDACVDDEEEFTAAANENERRGRRLSVSVVDMCEQHAKDSGEHANDQERLISFDRTEMVDAFTFAILTLGDQALQNSWLCQLLDDGIAADRALGIAALVLYESAAASVDVQDDEQRGVVFPAGGIIEPLMPSSIASGEVRDWLELMESLKQTLTQYQQVTSTLGQVNIQRYRGKWFKGSIETQWVEQLRLCLCYKTEPTRAQLQTLFGHDPSNKDDLQAEQQLQLAKELAVAFWVDCRSHLAADMLFTGPNKSLDVNIESIIDVLFSTLNLRTRSQVFAEFVQADSNYVNKLSSLLCDFLEPLKAQLVQWWPNNPQMDKNQLVLTRQEFGDFCSAVQQMQMRHSAFASQVVAIDAAQYSTEDGTAKMANTLSEIQTFMSEVYPAYFAMLNQVSSMFRSWTKQHAWLNNFITKQQNASRVDSSSLQALLLAPVQQMCNYYALLKKMVEVTPASDNCRDQLCPLPNLFIATQTKMDDVSHSFDALCKLQMNVEGLQRRLVAIGSTIVKKGRLKTAGYQVHLVLLRTAKGTATLLMAVPNPQARAAVAGKYKYKYLTELVLDGARLLPTEHPTTFKLMAKKVGSSSLTTTLLEAANKDQFDLWMEALRRAMANRMNRQLSEKKIGL